MTKKLGAAILTAVVIAGGGLAANFKHFIDPYEKVYKIGLNYNFVLIKS